MCISLFSICLIFVFASKTAFSQQSTQKMKIEIWSDVACPFCYIGQAHLRKALAEFPEKEQIEIEWKSFVLDPTLPDDTAQDLFTSLSERKGMPLNQVMQMTTRVEQMGMQAGLNMNFQSAKPVNTAKAHQLIQLAKAQGVGDAAEERLFKAYFEEGANIAKNEVLVELGKDVGLQAEQILMALNSAEFAAKAQHDIQEARALGINGVPFFRLNGKYGLSGAQPVSAMQQALAQAFSEWKSENLTKASKAETILGASCKPEADCN